MSYHAGELVRPQSHAYVASGDSIFLEFTMPFEADQSQYNERPSFMNSAMGNRMSVGRMSISDNIGAIMNDSQQTNAEFKG